MESRYLNRMKSSPEAAARLVTPRGTITFNDPAGPIRRGTAVRSDHPAVIANRWEFMNAPESCEIHPSAQKRRAAPKPKTKPRAKPEAAEPETDEG